MGELKGDGGREDAQRRLQADDAGQHLGRPVRTDFSMEAAMRALSPGAGMEGKEGARASHLLSAPKDCRGDSRSGLRRSGVAESK